MNPRRAGKPGRRLGVLVASLWVFPLAQPTEKDDLLARCRAARNDLRSIHPDRFLRLETSWAFDTEPGKRELHYRATHLQAPDGRFYLAVVGIDTEHRFRYARDPGETWAESMVSGAFSRDPVEEPSAHALSDQSLALQVLFCFPWLPEGAVASRLEGSEDRVLVAMAGREFVLEIARPESLPRRIALRSGGLRMEVLEWGRLEGFPRNARVPEHWRVEDHRFGQSWEERLENGDFDVIYRGERLADLLESRAVEVVASGPDWESAPIANALGVVDHAPMTLQGVYDLARRARERSFFRVAWERNRLESLGEDASRTALPAGTVVELTTVRNPRFLAFEITRSFLRSSHDEWLFQPSVSSRGDHRTLTLQVGRTVGRR
ncbi:MAG: hypothetical protein H6834_09525 [Planctomycetes bacterium]|nr:hypothetical protein [Planctomycetota bacterium]